VLRGIFGVLEKTVLGDTPGSPQFGLRLVIPEGHLALNRENVAPLFFESRDSLSIRLSGVKLELKMTANSTYWKAKVGKDGLEVGTEVREVIEGRFSRNKKILQGFFFRIAPK
jgi:hypothetical protein